MELGKWGNLEALSEEGVANFLDFVFSASGRRKDDQIDRLGLTVLLEVLKVGEGLTARRSEQHPLHAFSLLLPNSSCHKLQRALQKRRLVVLRVFWSNSSWHGPLQLGNAGLHILQHLAIVVHLAYVHIDLVNGLALLRHEGLIIGHRLVNGVEEQIVRALLLLLNLLYATTEHIY